MRHNYRHFHVFYILAVFSAFFLAAVHQQAAAENVTLAWDANPEPDVMGYRVYCGTSTGNYTDIIEAGNVTTATVPNLIAGTTYFIAATAYNSAGLESLPSSEISFTPKVVAANQPPTVYLDAPATDSQYSAPANIIFSAEAHDSDGTIARVEFYQGTTKLGENAHNPYSFTWNNVPPGTYSLSAIAFDNEGASTQSAAVDVTVSGASEPLAPPPATSVTATALAANEIALDWTLSPGATSYLIKRSTTKLGGYVKIAAGITDTSYIDSGLSGSTKYFYIVKALNSSGKSPKSAPASVPKAAVPRIPAVPREVAAIGRDAQVALGWTASKGAATYTVGRATDRSGSYATVASGLTIPVFTDKGVNNGTTYYYVVSAVGSGGESANSIPVNATPQEPLPSPWTNRDVGSVPMAGSAAYSSGKFTLNGGGAGTEGNSDEFHYAFENANEDCEIVAHINSIGSTDPTAKVGIMIRETVAKRSMNAGILVNPNGTVEFQRRTRTGGNTKADTATGISLPCWLKLTRVGNKFLASYSANGTDWTQLGEPQKVLMASAVTIGMAVSSGVDETICNSIMDSVTATP
ncbi:MAG: Ig-like domain-containing protein [Chthoniobacteraceae bacterium]